MARWPCPIRIWSRFVGPMSGTSFAQRLVGCLSHRSSSRRSPFRSRPSSGCFAEIAPGSCASADEPTILWEHRFTRRFSHRKLPPPPRFKRSITEYVSVTCPGSRTVDFQDVLGARSAQPSQAPIWLLALLRPVSTTRQVGAGACLVTCQCQVEDRQAGPARDLLQPGRSTRTARSGASAAITTHRPPCPRRASVKLSR